MALSDDLRKRVVGAVLEGGMSRNAAAKRFGVSIASAIRWVWRFRATGEISPAPTGGDRRSNRIEAHRDYLLGLIGRQPDVTLLEIQERLIANCGERFSSSVIWRFFDRHEITLKKKTAHAEEQQRPDVLKQRQAWFGAQLDLDPRKLPFSSMKPGLPPIWRAKADAAGAGGGCASALRMASIRRITLVAGLRLSGLVAQKAFDKPMNAATFEDWAEKCLVPTLSKGDVVVMDNLSSHKGPRVEKLIEAAGAELRYLPPYSPDMNPIEKAYSKLKAFLRKIAERTVSGLMNALDACAEIFKPAECVNYFKACGYDTD